MFKRFLKDDSGYVYILEVIIIATFLAILMIPAVGALRDVTVAEIADLGDAVGTINQSYSVDGYTAASNVAYGSSYQDEFDDYTVAPQEVTGGQIIQAVDENILVP
ncbi:MAG: Flp family type IVb pilin [Gemmataceae bacterium]